jgi:hypothetical protein
MPSPSQTDTLITVERKAVCPYDSDRYALQPSQVDIGDSVFVRNTGYFWKVVDTENLGNDAGYDRLSVEDVGNVTSVAGTAGQLLVNGGTDPVSGAITLSLPNALVISTSVKTASFLGGNNQTIVGSGTGGWAFTANGTNQNITLTPSGTGFVAIPAAVTAGIRLFNTADETTNTEFFGLTWSSNVARLQTQNTGSGTVRNIRLGTSNGVTGAQTYLTIGTSPADFFRFSPFTNLATSSFGGTGTWASWFDSATSTSTSGTNNVFAIRPTYNQASGTAANTDLLINRTETAVGSGSQFLIQAQVGGATRFSVSNVGTVTAAGNLAVGATNSISFTGLSQFTAPSDGVIRLANNAGSDFNRLQFGGTTASFPSIKRSATALQFKLADDSGNAPIVTGAADINGPITTAYDTRNGAGAVSITTLTTELVSTGVAQAITLANGSSGQIKTIIHGVDGGSMVLTPATATGFTTITFTNVGESATLQWLNTRGWTILALNGAVAA